MYAINNHDISPNAEFYSSITLKAKISLFSAKIEFNHFMCGFSECFIHLIFHIKFTTLMIFYDEN